MSNKIKLTRKDIDYLIKIADRCAGEGIHWNDLEDPADFLTLLWGDNNTFYYSIETFIERIEICI